MSFFASTNQSNKIKAIFELLFQNTATVALAIDEKGIRSECVTTQGTVIEVFLDATQFDEYRFSFAETQFIGLAMHVGQFFRSMKNKSTVILKMDKPFILDVECHQNDECSFSLAANIELVQHVANSDSAKYDVDPIKIESNVFAQMCKSFKHSHIDVIKRDGQIFFADVVENISTKTWTFGSRIPEDKDLYFAKFRSEQFLRVTKISTFADGKIDIIVQVGLPLALRTQSKLGTVSIFVSPSD